MTETDTAANGRIIRRLLLVVCAMFAFGYALVPIYDVVCDLTGLNGKTGRLSQGEAASTTADEQREVTVEFVTSVATDLPWRLTPTVKSITVAPGEPTRVAFHAENLSGSALSGQAVPSVAPGVASRYFNKTECFCFTQQRLAGGEARDMPVVFVVDPKLPSHIDSLTLSYTYFRIEGVSPDVASRPVAAAGESAG